MKTFNKFLEEVKPEPPEEEQKDNQIASKQKRHATRNINRISENHETGNDNTCQHARSNDNSNKADNDHNNMYIAPPPNTNTNLEQLETNKEYFKSIAHKVVFPEPDGPSIVKNSPLGISKFRSLTTSVSPS